MFRAYRVSRSENENSGGWKKRIAYNPSLFVRFSYRVDVADMKDLPIVKLGRAW